MEQVVVEYEPQLIGPAHMGEIVDGIGYKLITDRSVGIAIRRLPEQEV